MSICALKKFKIGLFYSEDLKYSATQEIIKKWLARDDVRNINVKEAGIAILHKGANKTFVQTSSPEWAYIYIQSGLYEHGDNLTSSIYFDDNDMLLQDVIIKLWSIESSHQVISLRLNYLSNKYDNYRSLGGFSLGYFDPIRNNRVYVVCVIDTTFSKAITRDMISSLYRAIKELYLEILPYTVCTIIDGNFKNIDQYKKVSLLDNTSQRRFFNNLKSNTSDTECMVYFVQ